MAKLYFGHEKSTKTARLEGVTKKFAKHLQEVYSKPDNEERNFVGRNDGMVLVNGRQLAPIIVEPDIAKLSWDVPTIAMSGVNKDAATELFKQSFTTQWSSKWE